LIRKLNLEQNYLEFLIFLRDNGIHSEKKQTYGQPRDAKSWVFRQVFVFDKIARLPKIAKPPKDGDAKPGV
jgi:hypothetical protein